MEKTLAGLPFLASELEGPLLRLGEDHLRRLLAVSHVFNSTIELDELIPSVLSLVLEVVGAEAGSLWLLDGDLVRCEFALGPASDAITGLELPAGAGIVGDAAVSGKTFLVADARSDPRFLHQIDEATGFETESVLTVPLMARGERLGAIQVVNSTDGKPFDQEDLDFLEALADDAAAALRNARLLDAEKKARDLKALLEFSHEITSTFDLDRVLLTAVNLAGRAIEFRRCVLALLEAERYRVRAISGEATVDRKSAAVREVERFLDWVREREGRLRVPDVHDVEDPAAAELVLKFPSYLETARPASLLVLPISDADGPLGALVFEFDKPDQPTEWGLEAAELLTNETALALRNAQLYREVPLIAWLEPLAEKRRALAALPAASWLKYGAMTMVTLLALTAIQLPLRVGAATSTVRAAVQLPARAQAGGLVEHVAVREGDRVERGDALAHVRDEGLLRRIVDADGRRELAERALLAAEAGGDPLAASVARVRLEEASEALRILRLELERSIIVAPTAGTVLTPRVEERVGEWLEPGGPLLWVGSPDWVELELRVRQSDIGEVRTGDRVRAKVPAHPRVTFEGRVSSVSPAPESLDGAPVFVVRAVLDNRDGLLRPGMEARARVHAEPRPLVAHILRRPWRWLRLKLWW
jgi:GAF domain-containing protein/multidrug efflux pump subunit AcrA (membrane-fusion protein)